MQDSQIPDDYHVEYLPIERRLGERRVALNPVPPPGQQERRLAHIRRHEDRSESGTGGNGPE